MRLFEAVPFTQPECTLTNAAKQPQSAEVALSSLAFQQPSQAQSTAARQSAIILPCGQSVVFPYPPTPRPSAYENNLISYPLVSMGDPPLVALLSNTIDII